MSLPPEPAAEELKLKLDATGGSSAKCGVRLEHVDIGGSAPAEPTAPIPAGASDLPNDRMIANGLNPLIDSYSTRGTLSNAAEALSDLALGIEAAANTISDGTPLMLECIASALYWEAHHG